MPELPEVESTRRGIEREAAGKRIQALHIHDHRLRWPVDRHMPAEVSGQQIIAVERRAKYLLLRLERGTMILHLGMSGSLRILPGRSPRRRERRLVSLSRTNLQANLRRSRNLRRS